MSDENGTVEFEDAVVLDKSKSGLALRIRFDGQEKWIPQSVIHDHSEVYAPGHRGTLVLKEWFAIKEGLI